MTRKKPRGIPKATLREMLQYAQAQAQATPSLSARVLWQIGGVMLLGAGMALDHYRAQRREQQSWKQAGGEPLV